MQLPNYNGLVNNYNNWKASKKEIFKAGLALAYAVGTMALLIVPLFFGIKSHIGLAFALYLTAIPVAVYGRICLARHDRLHARGL